jgi:hypothetical protein
VSLQHWPGIFTKTAFVTVLLRQLNNLAGAGSVAGEDRAVSPMQEGLQVAGNFL